MNIKGVFQIWMKDGSYHEIDLKECHQWTREGCKNCPDFAAEHTDIATGGIGKDNDWTLTIVRTELGEEVINRMIADGTIIARPAQEDEVAMKLLRTLSHRQPPPLARVGRRRPGDRRAAAEEEGGRARRRRPAPTPRPQARAAGEPSPPAAASLSREPRVVVGEARRADVVGASDVATSGRPPVRQAASDRCDAPGARVGRRESTHRRPRPIVRSAASTMSSSLDQHQVRRVAQRDERVAGGDAMRHAAVAVLDQTGQHRLADATAVAGLVDHQHPTELVGVPDAPVRSAAAPASAGRTRGTRCRGRPAGARRAATGTVRWPR